MAKFLRGTLPDPFCDMIDAFLETNNAINELIPLIMEDSSSSDEDDGHQYVIDVLAGHQSQSYNCFRIPSEAFVHLRDILVSRGLLSDTKNMAAAEQLGIFLRGVAHGHSYRQLSEFFQHSLENVSKCFNLVLKAILSLSEEFINLPQVEVDCHPFVRANSQFHPFFKNAIGAIDGTHIPAVVSKRLQNRYYNRKGFTSQNVMAAVSFDRQFLYVASGWEGSADDLTVLQWSMEKGNFRVPQGKYYLVDSDYENTDKLMAPIIGYQYHLSEYRGGTSHRYSCEQELYNHRQARLHNIVERTFGIWKERFKVLTHMPQFPLTVQADIVLACAILHNFIGRYYEHDLYFNMSQAEMQHDKQIGEVGVDDEDRNEYAMVGNMIKGDVVRDAIANDIWEAHAKSQRRRSI